MTFIDQNQKSKEEIRKACHIMENINPIMSVIIHEAQYDKELLKC